ncbi:ribosomal protein L5 [Sulfobacillus acidophilus DSM 10332]|uniref:Large ribosomal subunit protein uL5 n=1 Tax=Sulfobacillus acidophilus (strain ATCC 700253 / DSM 10332 / NAL) TaxID=679936 RepID=G8TXG9_SULAD|nr:ribosomal protein L5 [Sulfobacillus acidophilus DSM 10332]
MAIESALKERYDKDVVPALMERFHYKNPLEVPRLVKVVVNMGVGDAVGNPKALEAAVDDLTRITGQRPLVTRAKKSIASFKIRTGMPIGAKVTLRGQRMYDFVEKLFFMALPRVRDFRGVSTRGFDGRGNYTLGVKEQIIFPEIEYDKIDKLRGMDITLVTSANTDEEAEMLLRLLGMPFQQHR